MTALEQVTKLKGQGKTEDEIISVLQQQGVSPKEINDAIGQSQIKSAVSDSGTPAGMEPSVLQQGGPQIQEVSGQDLYAPQPIAGDPMSQEYAPQDYYQEGGYASYAPEAMSTDTMIEVAEQVFSEKVKKLNKQLTEANEFKTMAQTRIEHLTERVKKLESIIDRLQSAVLNKVGSYGQNLESIKKEMSMMQDSFGKLVKHSTSRHPVHPARPMTTHTPTQTVVKKKAVKKKTKKK